MEERTDFAGNATQLIDLQVGHRADGVLVVVEVVVDVLVLVDVDVNEVVDVLDVVIVQCQAGGGKPGFVCPAARGARVAKPSRALEWYCMGGARLGLATRGTCAAAWLQRNQETHVHASALFGGPWRRKVKPRGRGTRKGPL